MKFITHALKQMIHLQNITFVPRKTSGKYLHKVGNVFFFGTPGRCQECAPVPAPRAHAGRTLSVEKNIRTGRTCTHADLSWGGGGGSMTYETISLVDSSQ